MERFQGNAIRGSAFSRSPLSCPIVRTTGKSPWVRKPTRREGMIANL